LGLSENHAQHIENWRAHLKHERARCNRSFASLVLSGSGRVALWLLSGNFAFRIAEKGKR